MLKNWTGQIGEWGELGEGQIGGKGDGELVQVKGHSHQRQECGQTSADGEAKHAGTQTHERQTNG